MPGRNSSPGEPPASGGRQELPEGLTLYARGTLALKPDGWGGLNVASPTFPGVYALGEDLARCLDEPRFEDHERWPVAVDANAEWTDLRWGVFCQTSRFGMDAELVESIHAGSIPWDLTCPALAGRQSLVGQAFQYFGEFCGATPGERYQGIPNSATRIPVERLLENVDPAKLRAFRERGRSLLDLACEDQLWGAAECLWDAGVRWTEPDLKQGQALQSVLVGWRTLRGTLGQGWIRTGQARVDWLGLWLDRLEANGVQARPKPQLQWRLMDAMAAGIGGPPFQDDTPASMFGAWMFRKQAGAIVGPEDMPGHERAMLEAWMGFWARQGLDLSRVLIPEFSRTGQGGAAVRTRLPAYWNELPGLESQIRESLMEQCLPRPASGTGARGTRL